MMFYEKIVNTMLYGRLVKKFIIGSRYLMWNFVYYYHKLLNKSVSIRLIKVLFLYHQIKQAPLAIRKFPGIGKNRLNSV